MAARKVTHLEDNAQYTLCGIDRTLPRRSDRAVLCVGAPEMICKNCERIERLAKTRACQTKPEPEPKSLGPIQAARSRAAVTHLPDGPADTLCGKSRRQITICSVVYWRTRVLEVIKPSQCVDEATCKACHRVDDARQVRDYRRECREGNLDPDTGQPLPKKISHV